MDINIAELAQRFSDNDKARELLESVRWPNGATCPHCGSVKAYRLEPKPTSKRPGRKGRPAPLEVRRLPETIYRYCWDHL